MRSASRTAPLMNNFLYPSYTPPALPHCAGETKSMDQPTEPSPPAITAEKPDRTINVDLARDVLAATFETMRIRPNEDPAHLHIRESATYTALTSLHASDPVELMFAAHVVASHHATMECFRRAMCAPGNADAAARMHRSAALMSRLMADTVKNLETRRLRPAVVGVAATSAAAIPAAPDPTTTTSASCDQRGCVRGSARSITRPP